MSVLLLNVTYEPLIVVSIQRAICMLLEGKADVLEEDEIRAMRSPSITIPVPLVMRLRAMVKVPFMSAPAWSKRGVLVRDEFTCQFSGCSRKARTVDHLQPQSRGGLNTWENTVAACITCNSKKGNKTIDEMDWRLSRSPKPPRGALIVLNRAKVTSLHSSWVPYLPGLS